MSEGSFESIQKETTDKFDTLKRLEVFSEDEKKEITHNEIVKEWVEKYLPHEVLDGYALSYEKSKKSDDQKRQNAKYSRYYKKAEEELKPRLADFLESKIKEGEIDAGEDNEDEIKNQVFKTLNSDMHANRLLKSLNEYLEKSQTEDSETAEKVEEAVKSEIKPVVEEVEKVDQFAETKEDFFDKYKKEIPYIDLRTGDEFKILDFNPSSDEVQISVYKAGSFDSDNEALELDGHAENKTMTLKEFEEFFKEAFVDDFEEQTPEQTSEQTSKNKSEEIQEKIELNQQEAKIVKTFKGFVSDKLNNLKKEAWVGNRSKGGIMDDEACLELEKALVRDFWNEGLLEIMEEKSQIIPEAFVGCSVAKLVDYFKNEMEAKNKILETT